MKGVLYSYNWTLPILYLLIIYILKFYAKFPSRSPTHHSPDDEKGAKKSLRWLIWLNGSDYDIDNVALEGAVAKDESKDESFMENIRDIWKYKSV